MRWPEIAISPTIADVIRGVTFSQGDAIREPCEGYVPVLRAGNIGETLVTDQDLIWISTSFVSEQQILRMGDIIICTSSGSPAVVGKSGIIDEEFEGTWGAFNAVIRVRENAIPQFVFYFLQSAIFRNWRNRHATGANIQNIRFSDLAKLRMPLPSLSEQRRVVEMLDKGDRLRKLRRHADAKAARVLPALFLKMFGDPATNQKRWPVKKLASVAATSSGGTPDTKNDEFYGGAIPWVKSGELASRIIVKTEETITEEALHNSSAKWVEPGAILVAMYGATVGQVSLLAIRATTNQAVCAIKPGKELVMQYLIEFLRLIKPFLLSRRIGGAQPNISQQIIRDLDVPIPPTEIQLRFASCVEEMDLMLSATSDISQKLDMLFQLLMSRAFSGALTATWRKEHMNEVLAEMEQQAKLFNLPPPNTERLAARG